MNRNEKISLDRLIEGDRFYKAGDSKKKVLAVKKIRSKGTAVDEIHVCPGDQYGKDVKDLQIIKKPKEYQAIFLRHDIEL